ncbi:cysteine-rich receptor-like protein kinase 1 [Abrus precatorius]|uniref:Cysteine-rich receptor-like protein kinase 1 n=1 Tax=Abrus precatorius TaxID=3816 RepID=A0A8B8MJE3_ABRPR|nr:cysteine-rich receptor-like protein kinase 1 [Abrus precatorius]
MITRLILISSLLLVLFSRAASSDAGVHEAGLTCGSFQYPGEDSAKLSQDFMALMDALSFQVKEHGWGAQTLLGSGNPMYALGQCHRDLNLTQCYTCFGQSRQLLSRCMPKTAGRIYLDGCFLRYDNYSFFRESLDPSHDINVCESRNPLGNDGDKRVASVILNVTQAASERKFAVDEGEGVFALAQCWETLDKWNCERCLREAGRKLQECVPAAEGRSLFTGCFFRYSTRKFYHDVTVSVIDTKNSAGRPKRRHSVWLIVACVVLAIVAVLLIILAAFLCWRRKALYRKVSDLGGASPGFAYIAGFSFRYDLLEKATNYFDPANKLGQGGSGSVFKGTLPSGSIVAVKRLFFNTRHWTDGLFNELNLINGIQHKNVVKLLGCSIEGPESLLVYEFVPNRSLNQVLFGKDSVNALPWERRFQIICGIAEGLAYLHGGSGTKIIHRDIKSSNILLDDNLNPKIADFGLARCVAETKSHLSTGNTGTLEYLAPEYLVKGQMTEKSDIYAFGVLVVEIVCGKKNSVYKPGSTSILHSVWKNYKGNNITASVDPALYGKFKVEEASNALQAGLLCTQSSVSLRPPMSEVVQMLTKNDYVIPTPKQQPFLKSIVPNLDDPNLTSTMSIVSSNGQASARSSFHSTTSSLTPIEDLTVLENYVSSSPRFTFTASPDSNIQVNIGAPEPR